MGASSAGRRGRRAVVAGAALVAGWLAAAGALAPAQEIACAREQAPMTATELFFGRNIDGRHGVTEARFARFLAKEVAPRFPDGFTVLDGRGHWRGPARGTPAPERSKVVLIVAPDDEQSREGVAAIVKAYKDRFRQQSVLVLTRRVCAAF